MPELSAKKQDEQNLLIDRAYQMHEPLLTLCINYTLLCFDLNIIPRDRLHQVSSKLFDFLDYKSIICLLDSHDIFFAYQIQRLVNHFSVMVYSFEYAKNYSKRKSESLNQFNNKSITPSRSFPKLFARRKAFQRGFRCFQNLRCSGVTTFFRRNSKILSSFSVKIFF